MKAIPCDYGDLFPGGVPGWVIFGMQVEEIKAHLNEERTLKGDSPGSNALSELCFIGLIAYFEGFVRYHFASCVNFCPRLLSRFAHARPEIVISLRDIADLETIHGQVGFLLADRLGFSGPKEINAQFRDLLGFTPFSKNAGRLYDRILHDRHLIVHSAGIYTTQYLRASHPAPPTHSRLPYMDSVVVTPTRAISVAGFLLRQAESIVTASYDGLSDPTNWHTKEEMEGMKQNLSWFKWSAQAFSGKTE